MVEETTNGALRVAQIGAELDGMVEGDGEIPDLSDRTTYKTIESD